MDTSKLNRQTIDEYIAACPKEVQEILENIRKIVKEEAPDAIETIKYQMPTFMYHGNLVYFAAFKQHIGFYPPVTGYQEIRAELSPYEGPKASLIFPYNRPIPYDLIRKIVKFRIKENLERASAKAR